jgi:hypothetical protein
MGTRTALLLAFSSFALLRADDLMTRDGKLYSDYHVLLHNSKSITIAYADGAANIPIANLPADLQQKYGGADAVSESAPGNAPPADSSSPPAPSSADPSTTQDSQGDATDLTLSVLQATPDGVLGLESDGQTVIFVSGASAGAEGQPLSVRATRSGTYSYVDANGISQSVDKWTAVSQAASPGTPTSDPLAPAANSRDWTVNGTTYRDVIVLDSNEFEVEIASGGKVVTLYLKDLPTDLQQRFHYNEVKAAAAELKEKSTHHGMDEVGGL